MVTLSLLKITEGTFMQFPVTLKQLFSQKSNVQSIKDISITFSAEKLEKLTQLTNNGSLWAPVSTVLTANQHHHTLCGGETHLAKLKTIAAVSTMLTSANKLPLFVSYISLVALVAPNTSQPIKYLWIWMWENRKKKVLNKFWDVQKFTLEQ